LQVILRDGLSGLLRMTHGTVKYHPHAEEGN
jgi:hypothetical protein